MAAIPSSLRKTFLTTATGSQSTSSKTLQYSAVVAIDFGTTYSGYAYAYTNEPNGIFIMNHRSTGLYGSSTSNGGTQQPTVLLLTADEKFHSFGNEAQEYYRDVDEQESLEMLYFEKFKMELHSIENLEEGMELIAANGQTLPASTVFAHALRYFKDLSLYELNKLSPQLYIGVEDVQWVITVPAIWRPSAKQFMRKAAVEANLITASNPKQLILALEPEAASVYCQQLEIRDCVVPLPCALPSLLNTTPLTTSSSCTASTSRSSLSSSTSSSCSSNSADSPAHQPSLYCSSSNGSIDHHTVTGIPATCIGPGISYIVADCGGGTIDLTVHQIEDNGRLKELCKSSGGAWGSIGVDCQFEMLLVSIFGEQLIQDFINKHPVSWLDLMKTFEAKKRAFNPLRQHASNISLPFAFIHHYTSTTRQSIEQAISLYGNPHVQWSSQGMLRLLSPAMMNLFEPVVNTIIKHIHRIISHCTQLHNIQYLFLVGGFAESSVLQHAIRESFGETIRVIIPQDMSLCILKGAVMYGLNPNRVNLRQSVLTYGVACLHKYDPSIHPSNKRVVKDGAEWCTGVFDTYVSSGQPIPQGYSITRTYKLARSSLQSTVLTLFATKHKRVKFVTDSGVKKIGELRLNLSSLAVGDRDSEIHMTMIFGDTEITVKGCDSKSGQTAFAQIDFLCKK